MAINTYVGLCRVSYGYVCLYSSPVQANLGLCRSV